MLINLFIASAFVLLSIITLVNFERLALGAFHLTRKVVKGLVALARFFSALHYSFRQTRQHFNEPSLTPTL